MMQRSLSGRPLALSRRVSCLVGGEDGGGKCTIWVGVCSLTFWNLGVSMLSGHVEKIDMHTEELKDGIAQD